MGTRSSLEIALLTLTARRAACRRRYLAVLYSVQTHTYYSTCCAGLVKLYAICFTVSVLVSVLVVELARSAIVRDCGVT
jgi:hypothetical protein